MTLFAQNKLAVLKQNKRFLLAVTVVLVAKLLASLIIYYTLNVGSNGTFWTSINVPPRPQNLIFTSETLQTNRFLDLFVGWDSAWYLSIQTKGYVFSPQSYSFFPMFPAFGRIFSLLLLDPVVSLVLCSLVFGVLWVPIYQRVAEFYMSRKAALISTLLFALSPYIFLFTTLAYSEALLLFFSLSAWYFFKKGKVAFASISAALAALSRAPGILIILPMMIETARSSSPHKLRNFALTTLPIIAFIGWLAYGMVTANDWFALVHTTEWTDLYSFTGLLFNIVPVNCFGAFLNVPFQHWLTPLSIWGSVILPPFLIALTYKIDKSLAIYSLAVYGGCLVFGSLTSLPRFIAVIFPFWLALSVKIAPNRKTMLGAAAFLVIFFLVSSDLWVTFLGGKFIA
jgi:hypothetical protein